MSIAECAALCVRCCLLRMMQSPRASLPCTGGRMELSFGRYVPLVSGGCPIGLQILCSKLHCTWCMCYSLFVVCACVCVHCTCVRCERCPSLPPPQQAAHPTTMCVKRRSEGPLPVGASCHSLWAAILSCEWCSAC